MPNQSSAVVVFNDDKSKVLLLLREDVRFWTVPEGGSEANETVEQTALRETFEETGLQVELTAKFGEYFRPNMPGGENLSHAFIARVTGGQVENASWEAADVQWFDVAMLPKRTTIMSHELIQDALQFSGELIRKTQRLPNHISLLLKLAFKLRDYRNIILGRH